MGAFYYAVTGGDKCACGFNMSFLEEDRTPDTCEEPCAGDSTVTCGDDFEYDLYLIPGESGDSGG